MKVNDIVYVTTFKTEGTVVAIRNNLVYLELPCYPFNIALHRSIAEEYQLVEPKK